MTNYYLMWVGSESYPNIEGWVAEAINYGVSKRLPNVAIARLLAAPDVVVFVAHDEGIKTPCEACYGTVECSDCRILDGESTRLQAEVDEICSAFADFKTEAPRSKRSLVRRRREKINSLSTDKKSCRSCAGTGSYKGPTGGMVTLKSGVTWDYKKYVYWLHQPKKWSAAEVVSTSICSVCGGKGHRPVGRVFGCFVPSRVDYILNGFESEDTLAKMAGFRHVTAGEVAVEPRRRCGKRKPGGTYVVTDRLRDASEVAKTAVSKMAKEGVLAAGSVDICGSFVSFHNCFPVNMKRFRGVARWNPSADLAKEAELSLDDKEEEV